MLVLSGCNGAGTTAQSSPGPVSPTPTVARATSRMSCSTALPPPRGPIPDKSSFKFTRVASGLQSPVYVTGAGDGSGRLFIVEQIGRIRILENGALLPAPFLDIRSLVVSGGERGLLSVTFH